MIPIYYSSHVSVKKQEAPLQRIPHLAYHNNQLRSQIEHTYSSIHHYSHLLSILQNLGRSKDVKDIETKSPTR